VGRKVSLFCMSFLHCPKVHYYSQIDCFNLLSVPICRYGSHGFEMINVTYVGDHLVAFKVTGDQNIPRGEVTFSADLSPPGYRSSDGGPGPMELDPIVLSEASAKKWGTKR
jgi:hypothetical protein